jgi:hypothetical protein
MKILSVGAGLFHADGQTDMTKLIVAFRSFASAPKKKKTGLNIPVWKPPQFCKHFYSYAYV